jgi:D-3-phosphoglycerate dehydrogenase
MKILANDGISHNAIKLLESHNFSVNTKNIKQENLIEFINNEKIEIILVRSATKIRKDLIDKCPSIKLIGRGGVGMDNIDVDYAKSSGIYVINTPNASSISVAELVFAHIYSTVRYLYDSNLNMKINVNNNFKKLKKKYSDGSEIRGKTIGIIGIGRIGKEVAKIAIGNGLKVIAYDPFVKSVEVSLDFYDGSSHNFNLNTSKLNDLLENSDIITIHVPNQKNSLITIQEIKKMKKNVILINTSRGDAINEKDLIYSLKNNLINKAGIDVFKNEPNPDNDILSSDNISLTPHIGAATVEAQNKIGIELANQIISIFK